MKKSLIIIALFLIALSSCSSDEPKAFKIDPNAMIYIKPSSNSKKLSLTVKSSVGHLSSLEIVKRATTLRFYNDKIAVGDMAAGFAGKDTTSVVPAFLRYGTDIINEDGFGKPYLVPDFIYAYDCVIEVFRSNKDIDTIAYIPNSVLKNARINIISALEAKDTASVYTIFNKAFTFIPITGPEYRELKKQNLQ